MKKKKKNDKTSKKKRDWFEGGSENAGKGKGSAIASERGKEKAQALCISEEKGKKRPSLLREKGGKKKKEERERGQLGGALKYNETFDEGRRRPSPGSLRRRGGGGKKVGGALQFLSLRRWKKGKRLGESPLPSSLYYARLQLPLRTKGEEGRGRRKKRRKDEIVAQVKKKKKRGGTRGEKRATLTRAISDRKKALKSLEREKERKRGTFALLVLLDGKEREDKIAVQGLSLRRKGKPQPLGTAGEEKKTQDSRTEQGEGKGTDPILPAGPLGEKGSWGIPLKKKGRGKGRGKERRGREKQQQLMRRKKGKKRRDISCNSRV